MSNRANRSQSRTAPRPEPRADAPRPAAPAGPAAETDEGPPPAPWHFKVLLVGTVGYLIYRLVWFIFWLTGHAWHG